MFRGLLLRLNGTLHLTFTKIESASNYSVYKGKMENSYTGLGEYTALSREMGILVSERCGYSKRSNKRPGCLSFEIIRTTFIGNGSQIAEPLKN